MYSIINMKESWFCYLKISKFKFREIAMTSKAYKCNNKIWVFIIKAKFYYFLKSPLISNVVLNYIISITLTNPTYLYFQ